MNRRKHIFLYLTNQGEADHPMIIAQLIKRDGSFLLGREADSSFDFSNRKITTRQRLKKNTTCCMVFFFGIRRLPDFLPFFTGSRAWKVAVYLCFPLAFISKLEIKCCRKVASHPRKYFSV